jgi:hypothetical protein
MKAKNSNSSQACKSERQGLSVVFLHHNRPWSIEIAVKALKMALQSWKIPHQLIVADDGSDLRLQGFLESLGCDEIIGLRREDCGNSGSCGISDSGFHRDAGDSRNAATTYSVIQAAYSRAVYPYLLHVEDDFWILPQGFDDHGKCHLEGLSAIPAGAGSCPDILSAAAGVLETVKDAHVIELARSFSNRRYESSKGTESSFCRIPFRAKIHAGHPRFYTCAWPHMMRTEEIRSIQLPLGLDCWDGEMKMGEAFNERFGAGDWVYMPERCYFYHVNIFTWRRRFNRSVRYPMIWTETESMQGLRWQMEPVADFNEKLLEAFINGDLKNDVDLFFSIPAAEYVYKMFYEKVTR